MTAKDEEEIAKGGRLFVPLLYLLMLILLGAIWGASYPFMRIAAPILGPVFLVEVRVVLAGMILLLAAVWAGQVPDFRTRWRQYLLLGAINAAIPFVLISFATTRLTASLAAILNGTTPLFTALVAAVWMRERLTPLRVGGLVLGFVGVGLVVGWTEVQLSLPLLVGVAASLTGAFCYGLGNVYAKRAFTGVRVLPMAGGQQIGAAALLLPFAALSVPASAPTREAIWAVLALALLCTAFAYLLYFFLIARVGPTSTALVAYLVPFFGIFWGSVLLQERLSLGAWVGLGIILTSVTLVSGVRLWPRT